LIISVGLITSYYLGEATGIYIKFIINTWGIVSISGEKIGGLFGTAIATMGMFCTGVYVLSMSGFGPIADNAGIINYF